MNVMALCIGTFACCGKPHVIGAKVVHTPDQLAEVERQMVDLIGLSEQVLGVCKSAHVVAIPGDLFLALEMMYHSVAHPEAFTEAMLDATNSEADSDQRAQDLVRAQLRKH